MCVYIGVYNKTNSKTCKTKQISPIPKALLSVAFKKKRKEKLILCTPSTPVDMKEQNKKREEEKNFTNMHFQTVLCSEFPRFLPLRRVSVGKV